MEYINGVHAAELLTAGFSTCYSTSFFTEDMEGHDHLDIPVANTVRKN
jgi:hypothetical protein